MKDIPNEELKELEPEGVSMRYRPKGSKYFYAPGRDILGFYISLQKSVIGIVALKFPDKEEDVQKLAMSANGFVNEATGGERKLEMHEFLAMHDLVMKDIDPDVVATYTYLMTTAFMYRYVLGKRETEDDQVKPEDVGKGFEALYILSVLPEKLVGPARQHLAAFRHVDGHVFYNEPPCAVEGPANAETDSED